MTNKILYIPILLLVLFIVDGCAHQGPFIPKLPTVKFLNFDSLQFTPQLVKFKVRLQIKNHMPVNLSGIKLNYAVDLNGAELFTDTFSGLSATNPYGAQTVTVPFQITILDLIEALAQAADEKMVKITFRGVVDIGAIMGLGNIPFEMSKTMPVPKLPTLTFKGTEGIPLVDPVFKAKFVLNNPNQFAIDITTIKTHVELNGKKYSLLRSGTTTNIDGGKKQEIVLTMKSSVMKGLHMAFNVISNQRATFHLGGNINIATPYGSVYLPVSTRDLK